MNNTKTSINSLLPKLSDRWQIASQTIAHSRSWFYLLIALGSMSNVVYTCTVPLVGFGVIAGATLPRRKAVTVILCMWLINQLLGFTIHHYPQTFSTVAWGCVMGFGAVMVTLLSSLKPKFGQARLSKHFLWLGITLLAGYALYEFVIWLAGFFLGGIDGFTLPILWSILMGNAVWAIALGGIHALLVWGVVKRSVSPSMISIGLAK